MERCDGAMRWIVAMKRCDEAMRWSDAMERCDGALRWSDAMDRAMKRCDGAMRWSDVMKQCEALMKEVTLFSCLFRTSDSSIVLWSIHPTPELRQDKRRFDGPDDGRYKKGTNDDVHRHPCHAARTMDTQKIPH